MNEKEQSRYVDLPKADYCRDPSHNSPTHMVIPQGKMYIHVCPSCGKKDFVIPPQVSL